MATSNKCAKCNRFFIAFEEKFTDENNLSVNRRCLDVPTTAFPSITSSNRNLSQYSVGHQLQIGSTASNAIGSEFDSYNTSNMVVAPTTWTCNKCGLADLHDDTLFCMRCFALRIQFEDDIDIGRSLNLQLTGDSEQWVCSMCTYESNSKFSAHCSMCYSAKGTKPPAAELESPEDIEANRWVCLVCTVEGNHPWSTQCAVCGSERGIIPPEYEVPRPPDTEIAEHIIEPTAPPVPDDVIPPPPPLDSCLICGEDIPHVAKYFIAEGCEPHCRSCLANWIETQINESGKARSLVCSCPGKHPLKYKDLAALRSFFNNPTMTFEKFNRAQTEIVVAEPPEGVGYTAEVAVHVLNCPDCDTEYIVHSQQGTYKCTNPQCYAHGSTICSRHNARHCSPDAAYTDIYANGMVRRVHNPKVCPKCYDESGKDFKVNEVIRAIEDAFCDRCPHCRGYVGGPADFSSCLCLTCNHCNCNFCGFCYNYAGNRTDAHIHVRKCSMNPRENYYVESEEIWNDLMKERRRKIASAIIASAEFTHEQRVIVERHVDNLLK